MIHLEKITNKNIWKLIKLSVHDNQRNFVATNTESILEAYTTITAGGVALPFGIYDDMTPIGFVMIGYDDIPNEDNPSISKDNYCIWRFMIDANYQSKGYAKKAMNCILDYIYSYPCGKAEYCWLSYEPENTVAKSLYQRFGFEETGEYDGEEIIAVLQLSK